MAANLKNASFFPTAWLHALFLAVGLFSSCRANFEGKLDPALTGKKSTDDKDDKDENESLKGKMFLPSLVNGNLPAGTGPAASSTTIDLSATGAPAHRIILLRDYVPNSIVGRASLPQCFDALPPEFEVGEGRCIQGNANRITLIAGYFSQVCRNSSLTTNAIAATIPLKMTGCSRAILTVSGFTPAVRLDIE